LEREGTFQPPRKRGEKATEKKGKGANTWGLIYSKEEPAQGAGGKGERTSGKPSRGAGRVEGKL